MKLTILAAALAAVPTVTTACASQPPAPVEQVSVPAAAETAPDAPDVVEEAEAIERVAQAPATELTREQRFEAWKANTIARYSALYDPALVQRLLASMRLREELLESDTSQPEFTRPVWGYLDSALSPLRVRSGQENLVAYDSVFRDIGQRYRVDPAYLTAIWGLETSYGANMGENPLVDAYGTLGFEGRRADFFRAQLDALMELVASARIPADDLRGSWAGAMGQTQFIPTTMRDYAVDMDGDGVIRLRDSEADALGSAAHYLSRSGWVAGQPAMVEVMLPDGFDYTLGDGRTRRPVNEWRRLGVREIAPDPSLNAAEAKLIVPAGARGPKFLTLKNFDVIKRYNPSTSYAMGISALAETFKGRTPFVTDFPRDDRPLSFDDKKALQARLNALGYDVGVVDGIIGPATRSAVRQWQLANGLVADGYVEQTLLQRILG